MLSVVHLDLLPCAKVSFIYARLFVDLFNYLLTSTRSMGYIYTPFDFRPFYLPELLEPDAATDATGAQHLLDDYLRQLDVHDGLSSLALPFVSDAMCTVIDATLVKMDEALPSLSYFHHHYLAWKEHYKGYCESRIQSALQLVALSPQEHMTHAPIKKRRKHDEEAFADQAPEAKRENFSFADMMLQEIHDSVKASQDYQSYLERILKE